jgi:hypothetical protein
MNHFALPRLFSFFLSLVATSAAAFAADTAPVSSPLVSLEAPANQTLALVLNARGVQIYVCRPVQGDPAKFEWAFKAPEAELFDAQGRKVGRHYAGPTWELTDGGKVVGRVKSKIEAPDGKGIPWLLLEAVQASGETMGKVLSIQRVDTVGGKAPADQADATKVAKEVRVDYTATYKFYVAKP